MIEKKEIKKDTELALPLCRLIHEVNWDEPKVRPSTAIFRKGNTKLKKPPLQSHPTLDFHWCSEPHFAKIRRLLITSGFLDFYEH